MVRIIGLTVLVPALLLSLVVQAQPQTADTPYPHMAPLDQYLNADSSAEIALARSAAPRAISGSADVIGPRPARIQNGGQGHERFRVYGAAILDRRSR